MSNDSEQTVTKKIFLSSMDEMGQRMNKMDQRMDKVDQRMDLFVTKDIFKKSMGIMSQRLDTAITRLEEKMYTKEDHAKFMVWMDEAMTELRDVREERQLSGHQINRLDDSVVDHEKRICVLEKSN